MDFSQKNNKNGVSYANTLSETPESDSTVTGTQKKRTPRGYESDSEFSALLKKFKIQPLKNARVILYFIVLIIAEGIIFAASFSLRNSGFQSMIYGSLGIIIEFVYMALLFFVDCGPLRDELLKLSKQMQERFKIIGKPLNKKQASRVKAPFTVCKALGAIFLVAGLAGVIAVNVIYFNVNQNISFESSDIGTLFSIFYSISHLLSGTGLLMRACGATATKSLNEYRCNCGCMFSFMSRQDYDYKSEIRKHEATYENRDVAAGSVYSNGQKVGTIYKSECYEKTPASEWRHTSESWTDVCCVCGNRKKRSSSSMKKIRNL